MSYIVAQPIRALQDHAKRVDHVVVELPGYRRRGLTACALEFSSTWAWEKIDQTQLDIRQRNGGLCGNCLKQRERWVTM